MALLDASDPWSGIRQLKFSQYDYEHPAVAYDAEAGGYAQDAYTEKLWGVDQAALNSGGYNTKYQGVPEEVAPNVFKVTVQQPGAHKYDTAEAFYAVDPATGMGTLVEDPTPTRQISSREKWRDRLEKRILPIAATILTAGYGANALGANAATGAGTGAAAAGGTTFGLTPAQLAAAKAAAIKGGGAGALMGGGATAVQGGDLSDVLKAAAKGGVIGGLTGGVGSAGGSALGLGSAGQAALSGGTRALLSGGDAGDVATGALMGGVTAGANDYMKTDLGLDAGTRAAVIGGGKSLLTGGSALDAALAAGSGYFGSDSKTAGSTKMEADPYDYLNGDYNDLDFSGSTTDFGFDGDGVDDLSFDLNGAFTFDGVGFDFSGLGASSGGPTVGTSDTPDILGSIRGALSGLGLNDKDVIKLLAGGFTTAYTSRQAEKQRDANSAESDARRAESRQWQLDDRAQLWGRQDAERDEKRVYEDKLLQDKFNRMRPAGLLGSPKLVKVGG